MHSIPLGIQEESSRAAITYFGDWNMFVEVAPAGSIFILLPQQSKGAVFSSNQTDSSKVLHG